MARPETGAAAFRLACRAPAVACLIAVTVSCAGADADRSRVPAAANDETVATPSAGDTTMLVPDKPKKPSPPVLNSDPERLVGMGHAGLIGLLGAPVFLRNDAPAQLWRYRHESCVLDLYLYSERGKPGIGFRVRHYDVRSRSSAKITARECLAALLKSQLSGKS